MNRKNEDEADNQDMMQALAYQQQLEGRHYKEKKLKDQKSLAKKSQKEDAPPVQYGKLEQVMIMGDLSVLSEQERFAYYIKVCKSVGLNPFTRPLQYLHDKKTGKISLYAGKEAAAQLQQLYLMSVVRCKGGAEGNVYKSVAKIIDKHGREMEATGVVPIVKMLNGKIIPLSPDELANAMMKADTKAIRRGTLLLAGCGMLDETEIETIKDVTPIPLEIPNITPDALTEAEESTLLDWQAKLTESQTMEELKQAFDDAKKHALFSNEIFRKKITQTKDSQKDFLSMREVKSA